MTKLVLLYTKDLIPYKGEDRLYRQAFSRASGPQNMENKIQISFVMTALNEEQNIGGAIGAVLKAFDDLRISGNLIVVNDGSTDGTEQIIDDFIRLDKRIIKINHAKPEGVGRSYWEGVQKADGEAVCYTPGDNENAPSEILKYLGLLEHVDFVVPFVFNKEVRSPFRRLLSDLFKSIINFTFGMNLNYTNGTVLYRTEVLRTIDLKTFGFLYQAEVLVKLIKKGYLYAEVPYALSRRNTGKSKAVRLKSFFNVVRGYLDLFFEVNFKKKDSSVLPSSVTARRRLYVQGSI